jgi:hypothetical protein
MTMQREMLTTNEGLILPQRINVCGDVSDRHGVPNGGAERKHFAKMADQVAPPGSNVIRNREFLRGA